MIYLYTMNILALAWLGFLPGFPLVMYFKGRRLSKPIRVFFWLCYVLVVIAPPICLYYVLGSIL